MVENSCGRLTDWSLRVGCVNIRPRYFLLSAAAIYSFFLPPRELSDDNPGSYEGPIVIAVTGQGARRGPRRCSGSRSAKRRAPTCRGLDDITQRSAAQEEGDGRDTTREAWRGPTCEG